MVTIDEMLAILAEPTRRRIVEYLSQGPKRTSELADALGISVPAISRHLKALRSNGVVVRQDDSEDGRARRYSLLPEVFAEVARWTERASWANALAESADSPAVSAFLSRAGAFLDAFAQANQTFFTTHLSEDVLIIFPDMPDALSKKDVLDSVGHHPEWRRYEVLDQGSIQRISPTTTFFCYKALVQNANDRRPRIVWISTIFRDEHGSWQLSLMQWTRSVK